jgi:hypothetical protein
VFTRLNCLRTGLANHSCFATLANQATGLICRLTRCDLPAGPEFGYRVDRNHLLDSMHKRQPRHCMGVIVRLTVWRCITYLCAYLQIMCLIVEFIYEEFHIWDRSVLPWVILFHNSCNTFQRGLPDFQAS